MGAIIPHPHAVPPIPAVARILSQFDREKVEAFIEIAIGLLDTLDGDPDREDGDDLEDDFQLSWRAKGIGGRQDADTEAGAYAEWHTLRAAQRKAGSSVVNACGHEDDEDDDPAGVHDEDGANTLRAPRNAGGPGCRISDPGGCEHTGLEDDASCPALWPIDQTKGPLGPARRLLKLPDEIPPSNQRLGDPEAWQPS